MPDFDTRRPQEPDRPSRMHMFVAASRQHMFGVASRLRTPVRALLRNRNMLLRLALAVGILVVVVEWAYVISRAVEGTPAEPVDQILDWAVETPVDQILDWAVETPSEQLGQEIKPQPTPAYDLMEEDPAVEGSSEEGSCEESSEDTFGYGYECLFVDTKATDPVKLASITAEVLYGNGQVEFSRHQDWDSSPKALSYCFTSKNAAVQNPYVDLNKAKLLGRVGNCYIAVYVY
jgi:hypothetical protein